MDHHTYSNFVHFPDDLAGLIAYSLYKGDKIKFKEEHQDPALLDGFIMAMNLESQVDAYRSRAESLLEEMTEEVANGVAEEIKAEFDARIRNFEKLTGFLRSVWSNLIASLLTAVVLIAIALVAYGNKIGFATVLGDAVGLDIKTKNDPPQ